MVTYPNLVTLHGNQVTLGINERATALVISAFEMPAKVVLGVSVDVSEVLLGFQNGTLDFFPVALCEGSGAINICKAGLPNEILATALLGLVA